MNNVLQLRISLCDIYPQITRVLEVEDTMTFNALHHVIQLAMGWENRHVYEFKAGEHLLGDPNLITTLVVINDREVKLNYALQSVGDKVSYLYDFGDHWMHDTRWYL